MENTVFKFLRNTPHTHALTHTFSVFQTLSKWGSVFVSSWKNILRVGDWIWTVTNCFRCGVKDSDDRGAGSKWALWNFTRSTLCKRPSRCRTDGESQPDNGGGKKEAIALAGSGGKQSVRLHAQFNWAVVKIPLWFWNSVLMGSKGK